MVAVGFVRSTLALKNEAIAFHLVSGNIVSLGSIIWIWAVSLWGRTLRRRLQSINEINIETTNLLHFLPNELVGVDLPLKDSVIGAVISRSYQIKNLRKQLSRAIFESPLEYLLTIVGV